MSDDLLSNGKLNPANLAEIFKGVQLPDSTLFGSGLDKIVVPLMEMEFKLC